MVTMKPVSTCVQAAAHDDADLLLCPLCGCDSTHVRTAMQVPDDHGTHVVIGMECAGGHAFAWQVVTHNGRTELSVGSITKGTGNGLERLG